MIGVAESVMRRTTHAGGAAGGVVALRLASCGAVIRPQRSLTLSLLGKGVQCPPLTSPRGKAFRPHTLTNPRRIGCAPGRELTA
jgi:hypothetical protein